MLWNWYTVDACFLSATWHVTSKGMFAGSCIGVIGLVLLLEFLRRLQREFDRLILPQQQQQQQQSTRASDPPKVDSNSNTNSNDGFNTESRPQSTLHLLGIRQRFIPLAGTPALGQQIVRAALHTMQFAVAYIIMLLAMYYNGYIIVCIFIGVFIGFMIFPWDATSVTSISPENAACCA